ncbi:YqgE/AlgH family protein [Ectothiorhodospiraceae bacterium BW-2]|nr:YqgE/AlgH family protein [Ectothiorhodospiraceae bacterium BW-2]
MSDASLKNQLLIATPSLGDSRFKHSVIYLCEHNREGAFGLVINQPTPITLQEILQQMEIDLTPASDFASQSILVLDGGPVDQGHGLVLHQRQQLWRSTMAISSDLAVTTSRDILESIAADPLQPNYLMTLGYAGWGAGQLEQELLQNSWLNVPASLELLFNTPYDSRWEMATRQLGFDPGQLCEAGHA